MSSPPRQNIQAEAMDFSQDRLHNDNDDNNDE